jgi:hypothetical protein
LVLNRWLPSDYIPTIPTEESPIAEASDTSYTTSSGFKLIPKTSTNKGVDMLWGDNN